MHRVCFDATTLLSSSRFRGTGTYCLGLIQALGRCTEQQLDGLDLHLMLGPARWLPVVRLAAGLTQLDQAFDRGQAMSEGAYLALKHTVARVRVNLSGLDLYHSAEPTGTPSALGCKTAVTFHDVLPIILRYPMELPLLPWQTRIPLERLRFLGVDHAIAISECSRQDLMRYTQLDHAQTSVVYHGLDTEQYHPRPGPDEGAQVARLLGSDRPYLLYLGGFDTRKQVPQMVEAFGQRAADVEQVLVICGEMWPNVRQETERQIQRYDLQGRVLMPGFMPLDTLPALYRQATAHVMLSLYEGFGMTITEAFACGCPVIATRASCVPEIAAGAALLVEPPPELVQQAADAMARVCLDQTLRQRLRQAGLERAAFFTWDRCAAQTLDVYRRILGR